MPVYFDISVPTGPATTVYPGDAPPRLDWPGWSIDKGNPANVGSFHGGLHHGTHVDAPWHFIATGKKIDELELDSFVDPCRVIDAGDAPFISADILENARLPVSTRRILFKTCNGAVDYWHLPWNPDLSISGKMPPGGVLRKASVLSASIISPSILLPSPRSPPIVFFSAIVADFRRIEGDAIVFLNGRWVAELLRPGGEVDLTNW
jgi:hypothetical protein